MDVTTERRKGVDWAKLARIERGVETQRAQARGIYDRLVADGQYRRDLVTSLGRSVAQSDALSREFGIDWTHPVEGLRRVPRQHLQALGIDPLTLDQIEELDATLQTLREAQAAAERELAPQVEMIERLKRWADHG